MIGDTFRPIFRPIFGPVFSGDGGGGWTPPLPIYPAIWSLTDGGRNIQRSAVSRTIAITGVVTWRSVRASTGITSGNVSTEFTIGGSGANIYVGVSTSSASMNDHCGADAHGFGWVGSTGDVYRSSGVVANFGTYAAGDVVRMEINYAAKTAAFYKGATLAGTLDISALSGTFFPTGSVYDTATITINCGQDSFAHGPSSGFTAGPIGPWGGWLIDDSLDVWLHDDTTGMFTDSFSGVYVTTPGDPVGIWTGGLDQYALETAVSSQRLEYQADGILLNSTGVIKYLYATISSDPTLPFYAAARMINVSGQTPRFNTSTAAAPGTGITGISASGGTKQRGVIRGTNTQLTADFAGSDKTQVVWYDGTAAYGLASDGIVTPMTIGAAVSTIERMAIRALNTENAIATIKCLQFGTGSLIENDARDLKYWMENYP